MSARELKPLLEAIAAAEKEGFEKQLGLQLEMARRMVQQLERLAALNKAVLDLNQKTIAELKSYSKPPAGVHQVMMATLMVLGENQAALKVWYTIFY